MNMGQVWHQYHRPTMISVHPLDWRKCTMIRTAVSPKRLLWISFMIYRLNGSSLSRVKNFFARKGASCFSCYVVDWATCKRHIYMSVSELLVSFLFICQWLIQWVSCHLHLCVFFCTQNYTRNILVNIVIIIITYQRAKW